MSGEPTIIGEADRTNRWPMQKPLAQVLPGEDNRADAYLARLVFAEVNPAVRVHVAADGEDVLGFLRRQGIHAETPRPDLILLDLNMPRMDGREALAQIKKDPDLSCIPVVVLTSSEAESDVSSCYALHANCYVRKPLDLGGYVSIVRGIQDFWLRVVELPPL